MFGRHDSVVIPVRVGSAPQLFAYGPALGIGDTDRFVRGDFKLDKICESLWQQLLHLQDNGYRPHHILLGRDFYQQFVGEFDMRYCSFEVPPDYRAPMQPSEFEAMFCGLTVHCIPWMEGAVLVPELTSKNAVKPRALTEAVEIRVPDPSVVDRMIAHLRKSFREYAEQPVPENSFVKTKRFLWWWR